LKFTEETKRKTRKKYELEGILDKELSTRLSAMGIRPGNEIEIVRKTLLGSSYYIVVNHRSFGVGKSVIDFLQLRPIES